jgi:hypothetical protein
MKSTLNNACISALLGGVPFGGTVNATGTASTPRPDQKQSCQGQHCHA